jgi:hypothetical protein
MLSRYHVFTADEKWTAYSRDKKGVLGGKCRLC